MTLVERLRDALQRGHRSTPEILPGDAFDERVSDPTPAAVLVPVVDRAEPTIIFTERPKTMRKHPGQVSFPGGRIDPGDDGPVAAALREAEEEIGLGRAWIEVIGTTDRYRTVTGFEVTPVVAAVRPGFILRPQADEVADVFEAPLRFVLDPARQAVRTVEWRGRERRYYEILWDGRRIWGATAAMLVNLSRRLALAP
ncbi:MAG: CoA pyrophosphatase [Alphaproteobacteria bacterium]|nr:CoA pyrophosphatase [Alphaproteobacteria bacterium]